MPDAGSVVGFRNIEVKPLPDDLPTPAAHRRIRSSTPDHPPSQLENFPLLDLTVFISQRPPRPAWQIPRKYGYAYGFVSNSPHPLFHNPPVCSRTGSESLAWSIGPQIYWQ